MTLEEWLPANALVARPMDAQDHTHNRLRRVLGRPYLAEPFVSEDCAARRNLDGGDASAEDHDEPVPMCAMERASVFCQSGKGRDR